MNNAVRTSVPETSIPEARRSPQDPSLLKRIYESHYRFFMRNVPQTVEGTQVEIGSGSGFFGDVNPQVVTSEIWPSASAAVQCSALHLPFANGSVSCLFLLDVLHHLQHPQLFFAEAQRTLTPGGVILMVEPANTLFGRFIYQNFHHEEFDPDAARWQLPEGDPRLVANGAIPWIILQRDKVKFDAQFPDLELQFMQPCMPFLYLVSGGLSNPQLLPTASFNWLEWIEEHLPKGLLRHIGMFYRIKISKRTRV